MNLKYNVNFRISETEKRQIEQIAKDLGVTKSSVWRLLLATIRILYSDLMLSDVLVVNKYTMKLHKLLQQGYDTPLSDAMRPIPELEKILKAKEIIRQIKMEHNSQKD